MAYRKIGTGWDENMRADIDTMFKELFREYTQAGLDAAEAREKAIQAVTDAAIAKETAEVTREEMLAIIREQTQNGDLAPEIAQARQGKATLGENLNSIKSELAQIAMDVEMFPRLEGEEDDTDRINRFFEVAPDGATLLMSMPTYEISGTLRLTDKKNVTIVGNGTTIQTDSPIFMMILNRCRNVELKGIALDGKEKARRGIEILNSPYTNVDKVHVKNIGNENETTSTTGIFVKEGSDFTKIRDSVFERIHANSVSCGIWVQSLNAGPENISKNVLVSACMFKDIAPIADADGVKALSSFEGKINLTVENSYFENCRKRGLKFQARGCYSFNNTFVLKEPNTYAAVDFQRGEGTSINDKIVAHIDSVFTSGDIFYTGIHISAHDVVVDGLTIENKSNLDVLGNSSRIIQIERHENMTLENIKIINSNLLGHYIEIRDDVENLMIINNKITSLRDFFLQLTNSPTLTRFILKNNEYHTSSDGGTTLINGSYQLKDSIIEIHHSPKNGQSYLIDIFRETNDYDINIGKNGMNFSIKNDILNVKTSGYPQSASTSEYARLFRSSKIGDVCYRTIPVTTEEYIEYGWFCYENPSVDYPNGRWRGLRQ